MTALLPLVNSLDWLVRYSHRLLFLLLLSLVAVALLALLLLMQLFGLSLGLALQALGLLLLPRLLWEYSVNQLLQTLLCHVTCEDEVQQRVHLRTELIECLHLGEPIY